MTDSGSVKLHIADTFIIQSLVIRPKISPREPLLKNYRMTGVVRNVKSARTILTPIQRANLIDSTHDRKVKGAEKLGIPFGRNQEI